MDPGKWAISLGKNDSRPIYQNNYLKTMMSFPLVETSNTLEHFSSSFFKYSLTYLKRSPQRHKTGCLRQVALKVGSLALYSDSRDSKKMAITEEAGGPLKE